LGNGNIVAMQITLDRMSRIVVPKAIRDRFALKPGDELEISVELDAIEPRGLRDLVEMAIQRHLPMEQFAVLKAAEASERTLIAGLVGMIQQAGP
jgi:AbrB family looped-hinge helix DNA binding protein